MKHRPISPARTLSSLPCRPARAAPTPVPTPARDAVSAQLDRIYNRSAYKEKKFGPFQWLEGGKAYTTVEPSAATAGGKDPQFRYDSATGARRVLVAAAALVPAPGQPPLDPEEYSWSADGRKLLLFTNTRKVWRQNTRGDYWVLDVLRASSASSAGRARIHPHVREVCARRNARRLRPGQRPLGRGPSGRNDHAADQDGADDRQRHGRLGLRGRVRPPRRLPLEPGGRTSRSGTSTRAGWATSPDQQHRLALPVSRASRTPRPARRTRR